MNITNELEIEFKGDIDLSSLKIIEQTLKNKIILMVL